MLDLHTAVTLSLLPVAPGRSGVAVLETLRENRASPPDPQRVLARLRPELDNPGAVVAAARRRAARILQRARAEGIEAIGLGDVRYPPVLAAIQDPPLVLWVRGNHQVLAGLAVALVGSRAASAYAIQVAERLGAELAGRGVTVVSGLARGVDAAAHRGALEARGPTVAVLGSGPDVIYPPEHAGLAQAVAATGAVVGEQPPGTPPRAGHFPARNRIISGLSMAVVVVEAPARSGALITARFGLEQGREVMAVPGSILTGRFRGSHALLRDGAKVVEGADDILEEVAGAAGLRTAAAGGQAPAADGPARVMAPGEDYTLDELEERSGVRAERLLPQLFDLELRGIVRRVAGGRFVRVAPR